MLLASAAVLFFYNQFDYPGLFSAVPLSVALATAWAAGRRGWALAVAAWFGGGPLVFVAVSDLPADFAAQLVYGAVSDLALLAAVLLLGEAVRGRRALDQEHRLLLAEQDRSERLLLNVLPSPIAARLKQGEAVIADGFSEVTVLFADLVDFTRRSQQTTPEQVVQVLDGLFSALDRLAERHGLEKIKTIGDAYMAVGGLPEPRPDHAEAVAEMALAVREEVPRHLRPGRPAPGRAHRHRHRPGGGRGDRHHQVQLRPVGRHRQHGQPHGVAGGGRLHPGDRADLPAAAGRLPLRAPGTGPGQGQGRAGHLVPPREDRMTAEERYRPARPPGPGASRRMASSAASSRVLAAPAAWARS